MARVPASERTRNALKDMLAGKTAADKSSLVRQAARLIVEEALEGEAADALGGRGYYEHGADRRGYRNGNRLGRVKSAEGEIEFAVPQLADLVQPFRSKIREVIRGRTEELERLAVEMYARGLSVRDIEAAFTDEAGRSLLSRTAASELTERLWADYQSFAARDLSEFKVLYLFVDGIAEKLHLGQPREAVLAAWGITETGHKVLLGLAPGTKEDTASCRDFLRDLKARNLVDPVLVITDGAPGLIRAAEEIFPRALRQRCLAHKIRNLQSKVPEEVWRELKGAALAAYQAGSPQVAQMLKDDFAVRYERDYPSATSCFLDDFAACIAHLQLPISHRRATRTTNMLERLFGEERRRTKVIPHAFGERAVLKLMYAALIRASETWKNIVITQFELRQLEQLREHLNERHVERTAPAVKSASRSRVSSKART
ncbi:MAG TPA: IS256 family transposase [Burkholderiales bacterium]|nr:IS256 family transposase [Burkholderiales bacterium]